MPQKPVVVDLFCGCGGFGLGAELAGFVSAAAIDIDSTLSSAYKLNLPSTSVITGDLSKFDRETWDDILGDLDVDGVIGGPPCQGYSRMGKSEMSDPRRSLLKHFFLNVNIINPAFFVMENVEGLLDKKNQEEFNAAVACVDPQYKVLAPIIIDASELGTPTKRKRVIIIGYDPLRVSDLSESDILNEKTNKVTVKEAISDLGGPIPQLKNNIDDYGWQCYSSNHSLSDYSREMRAIPPLGLGWPFAVEQLFKGKTSGFFDTLHNDEVKKRYACLEPGSVDKVSRSKRLDWDGLCPTIRAGTGSDKGSHQAVRPIHPKDNRVITVREAARLQGFPDWYVFHPTKWHSFRMIGNSVSPIVSRKVLRLIKEKLKKNQSCEEKNDRPRVA